MLITPLKILAHLKGAVLENYSIDTYILPANRQEEIHVMFHDYMKYISREFPDKQSALEDREVISTKCYICHKKYPEENTVVFSQWKTLL